VPTRNSTLESCIGLKFRFAGNIPYHRQRDSDCTVLTATGLVNGEGQILTPYRIETPKPIDIKFGTGNYVGETTPCAKFGANQSTGASGQIGEI